MTDEKKKSKFKQMLIWLITIKIELNKTGYHTLKIL